MDIDLTKPLYIFILDLSGPGTSLSLPKSLLRRCSMTCDKAEVTPGGKRLPAVRGSTTPFGSWSKDGRAAVPVDEDKYGILVNEFIPDHTQYKWLDLSGSGIKGDIDPESGYCYEPDRFVDRRINCGNEPKPGEEIVIIVDKWGKCDSEVTKTSLEEWILNAEEIDDADDIDITTSTKTAPPVTVTANTYNYSSVKKDEDKDEDTTAKLSGDITPDNDDNAFIRDNKLKDEENNEVSEIIITTETIKQVHAGKTSSAPKSTKDDIDNNNMALKKTNTAKTSTTTTTTDRNVDYISETASKRMLRISQSDAPEVDQVLEVIVCKKASTMTIKPSKIKSAQRAK